MSEARTRANRKWNEANLDRLYVTVPKGDKQRIRDHAEIHGESVNGFIKRAISETMARDKTKNDR